MCSCGCPIPRCAEVEKRLCQLVIHVWEPDLELDVEASGRERAVASPDVLVRENASATSFASQVPGMSATGKSQVAVKTMP